MSKKEIGHTGEFVSPIGLGTYNIRSYKNAMESFLYAIQNGVELIDTAEIYGTEDFVGELIKKVGREKIFVVTKIWPDKLYSEDLVQKAAENSLKRLGIPYADLMLIHWPNREISIERQVKNFEIVCKKGYTRFMGVSNFNSQDIKKAIESTNCEIHADEVKFSVIDRKNYFDLKEIIMDKKITLLAYTPIERGNLSQNSVLANIARKYNVSPVQLSINYLIQKENTISIPKTENKDHMVEILNAMNFSIQKEDVQILDKI